MSLTNFRFQLIKAMVDEGHKVIAFAPEHDPDVLAALQSIGVHFIQIPMARTGLNPFIDLKTLYELWKHFRRLKPDLIMPYTMKPIIYGGIAGRLAKIPDRCFLVTGLGHVFSDVHSSWKLSAVRRLSIALYKIRICGCQGCICLQRCR